MYLHGRFFGENRPVALLEPSLNRPLPLLDRYSSRTKDLPRPQIASLGESARPAFLESPGTYLLRVGDPMNIMYADTRLGGMAEWIYGDPPQDVDFVRLVGDEVVRLESMKVDGEKIVHTEKEVDLGTTVAKSSDEPRPPNAPSLRRPGEEVDTASPVGGRAPMTGPPPDPLGQDGPTSRQPN